eukprot:GILK01009097.1.p1 GENE.GILK01009097.1~~GILK01009097.1.p1  ORF type:complete len:1946 (-),score=334.09 GILK01009097.1:26-5863(-)
MNSTMLLSSIFLVLLLLLPCKGTNQATGSNPIPQSYEASSFKSAWGLEKPLDKAFWQSKGEREEYGAMNGNIFTLDLAKVRFTPSHLEFKPRPLNVPTLQEVQITNLHAEAISLSNVFVDNIQFHVVMFHVTIIPPNSTYTLQVAYLPTALGRHSGLMLLEMNAGSVVYLISAEGIPNPYRVLSSISMTIPLGMPHLASMDLYNPFDETLQIQEVYTTEGHVQLSLPTPENRFGRQDIAESDAAEVQIWEIEPKSSKKIIQMYLNPAGLGIYHGLLHIKTSKDNMVVPVDLTVIKIGIHTIPDQLDFGTMTREEETHTLPLLLHNASPNPVSVSDVYAPIPDNQLSIRYTRGVLVNLGEKKEIGSVSFKALRPGVFNSHFLIRTNDSLTSTSRLEVPFKAQVVFGALDYYKRNTTFHVNESGVVKDLYFTNHFKTTQQFISAVIKDANVKVRNSEPGLKLAPNQKGRFCSLEFTANSTDLQYTVDLLLKTNLAVHTIPVTVYRGALECVVEGTAGSHLCSNASFTMSFDVAGVHEVRRKTINVTNTNPVNVTLSDFNISDSSITLFLDGLYRAENSGEPKLKVSNRRLLRRGRVVSLRPDDTAVLVVELNASIAESKTVQMSLRSSYERFVGQIQYESLNGSVRFSPELLTFESSFAGHARNGSITAYSTYNRPVTVVDIASSDCRIIAVPTNVTLVPLVSLEIAQVFFDPSRKPDASARPKAEERLTDLSTFDAPLTARDIQQWKSRKQKMDSADGLIHAELTVYTDVIVKSVIQVQAALSRPALVQSESLDFNRTHVGTVVDRFITVHNPSESPLVVQLSFPVSSSSVSGRIMNAFSIVPSASAVAVAPSSSVDLGPIRFTPSVAGPCNATLYIRNNLTGLEQVTLWGVGGKGSLAILSEEQSAQYSTTLSRPLAGSLPPKDNNESFLQFNVLPENYLDDDAVEVPTRLLSFGSKALEKSVFLVNNGDMPVSVKSLSVGDAGCAAFGFQLSSCEPFELNAGETKQLQLTYRPDFSASFMRRDLIVSTGFEVLSVSVDVVIAPELLVYMAENAPPTAFELMIRRAFFVVALTLSVAVLMLFLVELWSYVQDQSSKRPSKLEDVLRDRGVADSTSLLLSNWNVDASVSNIGVLLQKMMQFKQSRGISLMDRDTSLRGVENIKDSEAVNFDDPLFSAAAMPSIDVDGVRPRVQKHDRTSAHPTHNNTKDKEKKEEAPNNRATLTPTTSQHVNVAEQTSPLKKDVADTLGKPKRKGSHDKKETAKTAEIKAADSVSLTQPNDLTHADESTAIAKRKSLEREKAEKQKEKDKEEQERAKERQMAAQLEREREAERAERDKERAREKEAERERERLRKEKEKEAKVQKEKDKFERSQKERKEREALQEKDRMKPIQQPTESAVNRLNNADLDGWTTVTSSATAKSANRHAEKMSEGSKKNRNLQEVKVPKAPSPPVIVRDSQKPVQPVPMEAATEQQAPAPSSSTGSENSSSRRSSLGASAAAASGGVAAGTVQSPPTVPAPKSRGDKHSPLIQWKPVAGGKKSPNTSPFMGNLSMSNAYGGQLKYVPKVKSSSGDSSANSTPAASPVIVQPALGAIDAAGSTSFLSSVRSSPIDKSTSGLDIPSVKDGSGRSSSSSRNSAFESSFQGFGQLGFEGDHWPDHWPWSSPSADRTDASGWDSGLAPPANRRRLTLNEEDATLPMSGKGARAVGVIGDGASRSIWSPSVPVSNLTPSLVHPVITQAGSRPPKPTSTVHSIRGAAHEDKMHLPVATTSEHLQLPVPSTTPVPSPIFSPSVSSALSSSPGSSSLFGISPKTVLRYVPKTMSGSVTSEEEAFLSALNETIALPSQLMNEDSSSDPIDDTFSSLNATPAPASSPVVPPGSLFSTPPLLGDSLFSGFNPFSSSGFGPNRHSLPPTQDQMAAWFGASVVQPTPDDAKSTVIHPKGPIG